MSLADDRGWIDYWNQKVKMLTIFDLKLIQVGSMALILCVAKLLPQILKVRIWWYAAIMAVCAVRPLYVFWIKGDNHV